MTFPITKTADHTVAVGDLMSTLVSSAYLFPTYLVTSDGTAIGAANAIHVQPGTGATWAITVASLPLPSGAATSGNQVTELASLASLDGKTPSLGQALAAASVPVVLTAAQLSTLTPLATVAATQSGTWSVGLTGTVALPTGASTEAKQDTGNVSLASIDGKITAVNTGAVVVSSSALPSGAATAAKQPSFGTAGTPSADVVSIQGVASGTVVPIGDGGGSITVDGSVSVTGSVAVTGTFWQATQPVSLASVPSHAVTNAGTFAVQVDGAALTSLQLLDDAVATSGAASLKGNSVVGRFYSGATPSALSDDWLPIRTDSSGQVLVSGSFYQATQPVSIAAVVQVSQSGTWNVGLSSGTNGIGKLTANAGVTIGAVEIAAAQTLATVTTVGTVTTCSTVTTVSTLTGGGVAHDGVDSGNPHKIGARAVAALSTATMVAAADRTDAASDLDAAIIVRDQFPLGDLISERVTDTGGTSTAFTNFGATASTRNYVTAITVFNSSATAGYIDFRDGTGGAVLYTIPIPAGGGAVLCSNLPLFRTSANTALAYDVSGALSTVYISISGFKSKV